MAIFDKIDLVIAKTVQDLQDNLLSKWQDRASKKNYGSVNQNSRLLNSIKGRTFITKDGGIEAYIEQNDYWYWVNYGREKGGVAQYANIANWIKIKGIDVVRIISDMNEKARLKRLSEGKANPRRLHVANLKAPTYKKAVDAFDFIVRRKLKQEGYEGNYYFTEVVEDGRFEKLIQDIENEIAEDGFEFDDKNNTFTIRFK